VLAIEVVVASPLPKGRAVDGAFAAVSAVMVVFHDDSASFAGGRAATDIRPFSHAVRQDFTPERGCAPDNCLVVEHPTFDNDHTVLPIRGVF